MARPKLPRIDVRLDELAEASKNAEDYGEIVNVVVDEVVQKATKPLDNVMEQIQELLKDVQSMSTEDLNYFIAYLPTVMYFTTDRAELVGIKMDASAAIRREKYDDLYAFAAGKTIPDKESETRKLVMNEIVIETAYKRAYKKVQSKLEQADKVLASLKRVHQFRLNDIELTQYNSTGVTLHAKRNRRKDD
jgi:hypothetical protein